MVVSQQTVSGWQLKGLGTRHDRNRAARCFRYPRRAGTLPDRGLGPGGPSSYPSQADPSNETLHAHFVAYTGTEQASIGMWNSPRRQPKKIYF